MKTQLLPSGITVQYPGGYRLREAATAPPERTRNTRRGAESAAEALSRLRRAAREDLGHGRSFDFDGWVLAEAEAEACALLAPEG